jgi:hypothetical protein
MHLSTQKSKGFFFKKKKLKKKKKKSREKSWKIEERKE